MEKNKRDRKSENIALLEYLIKEFQTNPTLEDIRLGQLILNTIPVDSILYNIEAPELQKRITLSLQD